jgi:hypothetical protein
LVLSRDTPELIELDGILLLERRAEEVHKRIIERPEIEYARLGQYREARFPSDLEEMKGAESPTSSN